MFLSKQFKIEQGRTTMKVNTDGVLLACWASHLSQKFTRILDIGTGTGVIALICAQHYTAAHVDAIDVEEEAIYTADYNFKNSLWVDRMSSYLKSLQDFNPSYTYDFVISNPPFFENKYKSENENKNTARHTDSLSFDDIIDFQVKYLNAEGKLAIILPVYESELFIAKAFKKGLYLELKTEVSSSKIKEPHRFLMLFSKQRAKEIKTNRIDIYKGLNEYSEDYKNITKDFYLAF